MKRSPLKTPRDVMVVIGVLCAGLPFASFKLCCALGTVLWEQAGGREFDAWHLSTIAVMTILAVPAGYAFGRLFCWLVASEGPRWGIAICLPLLAWWVAFPWPETVGALESLGLGRLVGFLSITQVQVGALLFWFPFLSGLLWGSPEAVDSPAPVGGEDVSAGARGASPAGARFGWIAAVGAGCVFPLGALLSALATRHADLLLDRALGSLVAVGVGLVAGRLSSFGWSPRIRLLQALPSLLLAVWPLMSPSHGPLVPGTWLNSRNCDVGTFWGPALASYLMAMALALGRNSGRRSRR